MEQENNTPKYKIGDIVVITTLGTVGTITEIHRKDGTFLYKVNKGEGFYKESSLILLKDYQGKQFEIEHIEVEFKYYFGDLVIVAGYKNDIFKVVGIHTEFWRYKEGAWGEVIYELARVTDGEWLEAGEEELILLADHDQAETFLQTFAFKYLKNKETKNVGMHDKMDIHKKTDKETLKRKKEKQEIIDGLLDVYNDYKILYEMFQDQKYLDVMELALKNLKKLESKER